MNGELRREDPPETRGRKPGTLPRNLVTVRILDRLPALRRARFVWFAVWDFPGTVGAAAQWRKNHAHRRHFMDFEFKTVSRHDGSTVYARYVGPPVVPDDPDGDRPLGPDHPADRKGAE